MQMTQSKWTLPTTAVGLGLAAFAAEWAGGDFTGAVIALGIMVAFAGLIRFGGRSETIRGLRGDGRDERLRQIDLEATAVAGLAIILATIVGFLVEVSAGRSGAPFTWLGAIAGLAYLAAVVWLRLRG